MAPNPLQLVEIPLNLARKVLGSVLGGGGSEPEWPEPPGPSPEADRRRTPTGISEEEPATRAEPTPAELAARGEGRPPSPLGSSSDHGD